MSRSISFYRFFFHQITNCNDCLEYADQFRQFGGQYFGDWNLPFDLKSVMFYEESDGAKSPGLVVMRAKNGQKLRCEPHSCPTDLDIQKINTVYQCKNRRTNPPTITQIIRTTKRHQTNVCILLKRKSFSKIVHQIHNPFLFERIRDQFPYRIYPAYICRNRNIFGSKIKRKLAVLGYTYNV